MKKLITIASALCLMASIAAPASALEFTIDAPNGPEYGKPTSVEVVVTADRGEQANENLSKSAALIPPGFGTPTSYLPGSGELLTPNLVGNGASASAGTIGGSVDSGWAVLPSITMPEISEGNTTTSTVVTPSVGFTKVTQDMYYASGYLATLKIPSLDVNVKVYEGTDSNTLAKGAGHYVGTSIWDGNVVVAGHNRGVNCYFGDIHTLKIGDTIKLSTKLGTRTYSVVSVSKVKETDNSMLGSTYGNQITLLTCVRNQSEYRWCVVATEK